MKEASIVLGLGFGDEGKGLTTDYLCSQNPGAICVRFSGGQQAGHTVVLDGVSHVHSNYASGALRGHESYFTEHCTVYLNTISREADVLISKGKTPVLNFHPLTKLTTPYDVAFNRVTEKKKFHGTCGLGIGATMHRHITAGYKLFAMDLRFRSVFEAKVNAIRDYYYEVLRGSDYDHLDRERFSHWVTEEIELFRFLGSHAPFRLNPYRYLGNFPHVIFEGSQGIMLDMDHGIFPHVTYANTTSKNALEVCLSVLLKPTIYYVTRCYQTRHGRGWMSNHRPVDLINNECENNVENEWQGILKASELDYDLLNYALAVDKNFSHYASKKVVVTCLDQRPGFQFDPGKLNIPLDGLYYSHSAESKNISRHVAYGN